MWRVTAFRYVTLASVYLVCLCHRDVIDCNDANVSLLLLRLPSSAETIAALTGSGRTATCRNVISPAFGLQGKTCLLPAIYTACSGYAIWLAHLEAGL